MRLRVWESGQAVVGRLLFQIRRRGSALPEERMGNFDAKAGNLG